VTTEAGAVLRSTEMPPAAGARVFEVRRPVRLGDADERGRLRLDALARHLQDVASDDYAAGGMSGEPVVWVVRRAAFRVARWPRYLETLTYRTFCGGIGPQWAERRTSAEGDAGGRLETAVLWASLDSGSGRTAPLPNRFAEIWGVAGGGRQVSARLLHPAPPAGAASRTWPLRSTDIDVLGHVNNAGHWEGVEDQLARLLPGRIPVAAECEYRVPIDLGDAVEVITAPVAGTPEGFAELRMWLVSGRGVHASVVVVTEPAD
jgi:acyl-ACP thioesterase